MDLNYCTTMFNRSNYCSILKKRKSSYKENVTVKLKRQSSKEDHKVIGINNIGISESNNQISNDTMCLICRSQSECSTDTNCNSVTATISRKQKQQNLSKHENDKNTNNKHNQNYTNCVVNTSSTLLSETSSSSVTKCNALNIANQKSQSQWNAAAVNFDLHDSGTSCMPSCQLQSTSASSIPPFLSKTPSSSTSDKTKISSSSSSSLSPPPRTSSMCSSYLLLSSSSSPSSSSGAESTMEMSSSSPASTSTTTTSSQLSLISSASRSCSRNCMSNNIFTENSTSLSGISKSCANILRKNVRVTKMSVLRTLTLVVVILEKCFIGMFGTRKQMPPEHEIDNKNHVTVRKSKRSNNSFPLPIHPIMFTFLMFSFMTPTSTAMTTTTESNEIGRLQRNETVCKTRDIRNLVSEFNLLTNCTVIEGFLLISLINANASAYENLSFPMLTEVTEFVMLYRVSGLRTLSTLFPNLSVIRGKELFEGFALVLYENAHLEDVGLTSLTTIARGAVRMEKNPALCFVETIDWTRIAVNMTSDQHFFRENKALKECPGCPGSGQSEGNDWNVKTCGNGKFQNQNHCWSSTVCQKTCPSECKNNCNDDNQCCHESCIGGCANDNIKSCTSCRHFTKMDVCIDKCPAKFFTYLERRCVTAATCKEEIGTKLEGTKQEKLVPFNGVCSVRCPPDHTKIDATCVRCEGKCVKRCEGGLIDSVGAAKAMHGCTHIINAGLSISIKRGGRHLMEELEMGLSSIEEIETYLKVHRTYGMTSLAFFKNLKRIRGKVLESDKFALYVLENQDLERIWGENQVVKMDEGRVFFHFNPKLCVSEIEKLRPSLKNKSQFDKNEVATDSNGSKGSCNTEVLQVEVVKVSFISAHVRILNPMQFEDDRAFIGYQFFYTEDPHRNVSIFGHRPCEDSWSSEDPSKDIDHIFTSLKSYTQYAFYVKTHTISSEPRNGQSPIIYFRTKPDQPRAVQNLRAVANSSSEIIVHWMRPTVTNGNLTKYVIRVTLDGNEHLKSKSRNYCKEPLKEAATGDVVLPSLTEKSDRGLISTNGGSDCKCERNVTRKDGINPQMEEAIYENVIDFENNIQNFIYVKQTNESSPDVSRRRRRRQVAESFNVLQALKTPFTTSTRAPNSRIVPEVLEYTVNASVTEYVLKNLTHFTTYTIKVLACRAPEIGANTKECSPESIAYSRTQKLHDVDIVRNVIVELEQSNTTRGNLRIKWEPPERPNSLVVSYTIFYNDASSQDAVFEKRCITEADYRQNFTNGYILTSLPTGNYSIQVRANSLAGEGIKSEPVFIYIPPNRVTWQTIIWICIGVFIFICLVAFAVYYVRKKFLAPPSDLKIFPTVNPYYISMQYLPDEWEVPRDKIIQLGALGQGSFGMVYEGILKNFNSQEDTPCAIKTVNENATDRERLNFLKEASVMKQFNTHHVVRLLGVCSRGQPALVIMELMKNGDLKAYLRQHRPDAEQNHGEPPMRPPTLERIYQIAIEIADGMAYLAAKKYVHRDLAARNCMVAADLTVKIGDFGMTRDVYETDYYRKGTKGLLPVRWMSPESLKDGVFSSASDVFSYGVVLWEMATLASQPYQGFSNDQVLRFVIDGGVMERPENCPDKLYKVMQKCWQHRPTARPTFMEIIRFLLDAADPKFQEVSFYHSAEAKDMHDQMHPEHDMDDVTTPLRVGEFDYKLNMDDNSSVEPHESPALDEDDDDDNIQSHSPYSLGSAIIISSTPGNHSKYSPSIVMNKSNPSLSLPSTSAGARAVTIAASATNKNAEYVQPDVSYDYNEHILQQHPLNNENCTNSSNESNTAQKLNKNHTSSKYPQSLKRAVASTVQNVSNSLVPFTSLHKRLFKNNNNQPSQENKSAKSESSSNNGNNNNSNKSTTAPNVELGSVGSRSFFSGLTPSHTSKNPNYQILDESLNISAAIEDDKQPKKPPPRSPTGSCSSSGSRNSNRNEGNNYLQPRQQHLKQHQTTEQCNLNKNNTNLSTSSKFKDTKSSQKQNQPIISLAHELFLSSGVSNPISSKENINTIEASTAIPTTNTTTGNKSLAKTKTPYQLKEKWLQQIPPVPPNGFIGREG